MTFLSTSQLTKMRADVVKMLPDTAIIKAATTTVDSGGDWTEAYTAVSGGTVACRVDPAGKSTNLSLMVAEQEGVRKRYQLTVPHDAPLVVGYRVSIDSTDYELIQVDVDHSWNVSRRAIISEVAS